MGNFRRNGLSQAANALGCYPISSAGWQVKRKRKVVAPRVIGMSEKIVLIDTVIQLEQLTDGHRVWWADGYWHAITPTGAPPARAVASCRSSLRSTPSCSTRAHNSSSRPTHSSFGASPTDTAAAANPELHAGAWGRYSHRARCPSAAATPDEMHHHGRLGASALRTGAPPRY